jgi:hypothetical protein
MVCVRERELNGLNGAEQSGRACVRTERTDWSGTERWGVCEN